jgi:hypothetical protein
LVTLLTYKMGHWLFQKLILAWSVAFLLDLKKIGRKNLNRVKVIGKNSKVRDTQTDSLYYSAR